MGSAQQHMRYIFLTFVLCSLITVLTGMLTTEISVQHITPDLQSREESRICDL